MDMIGITINKISAIDRDMVKEAQARLDGLTKPLGSLGRLEELASLISGMTRKKLPVLKDKVIFTVASDHGVTDEGVSAYPKAVTAQMVYNFLRGGAGINVLARHVGARVVVVDAGVSEDLKPSPGLAIRKIAYGTENMAKAPAMKRSDAVRSIEIGIELFEEELRKGIDIVGTGDMGIGNTTASSAISAILTGKAVEDVTGRGTGIDERSLKHKVAVIRSAIEKNRPNATDPLDVLSKVGGLEIGVLAGIVLASAAHLRPIVIDGFISGAAALIAYHLEPKSREYMIASHLSVERGHAVILDHLSLRPILDLDLRLGEGTGAALGIGIADAAVKILGEMASFKDANVSEKIVS